ncbi:unnamed protein product [Allacma fusca]|uniref:Actin maturation protease n=1 Tax=Allacma fusca TaxID=39272 RepID=A0A8J2NK89_9HEXA|nr:unnamed protein product [Allacma fusca]
MSSMPLADSVLRRVEGAGPPPPPAPPVPPAKPVPALLATSKQGAGVETDTDKCFQITTVAEDDVKNDIITFITTNRWKREPIQGTDESGRKHFVAVYSHVQPILQQGPVCGLVALSMAGNLLGEKSVGPDRILAEAAQRGYSKKGEMFSVNHMKELGSYFYPTCDCEIMETTGSNSGMEIADILIRGDVILFPYDADFNHGPAVRNGHAAHWAVMHGILGVLPTDDSSSFVTEDTILHELGSITIINPGSINEEARRDLLKELFFNKNTFAICHQGLCNQTVVMKKPE